MQYDHGSMVYYQLNSTPEIPLTMRSGEPETCSEESETVCSRVRETFQGMMRQNSYFTLLNWERRSLPTLQ